MKKKNNKLILIGAIVGLFYGLIGTVIVFSRGVIYANRMPVKFLLPAITLSGQIYLMFNTALSQPNILLMIVIAAFVSLLFALIGAGIGFVINLIIKIKNETTKRK